MKGVAYTGVLLVVGSDALVGTKRSLECNRDSLGEGS